MEQEIMNLRKELERTKRDYMAQVALNDRFGGVNDDNDKLRA
jgi:hypothetical protein